MKPYRGYGVIHSFCTNSKNMCESLEKLRELTPKLEVPLFTEFGVEKIGEAIKYKIGKGTMLSVGLKKMGSIAVADTFMSKGSMALSHRHLQKEIVIVYEGAVIFEVDNRNILLQEGDVLEINSNTPHSVVNVVEDTHVIAITIPADKSFPNE